MSVSLLLAGFACQVVHPPSPQSPSVTLGVRDDFFSYRRILPAMHSTVTTTVAPDVVQRIKFSVLTKERFIFESDLSLQFSDLRSERFDFRPQPNHGIERTMPCLVTHFSSPAMVRSAWIR